MASRGASVVLITVAAAAVAAALLSTCDGSGPAGPVVRTGSVGGASAGDVPGKVPDEPRPGRADRRRRASGPVPAAAGGGGLAPTAPDWDPFVRVKWPDGTPAAGALAMIGDLDGGDQGWGLREGEAGAFPSGDFVSYWHISAAALRDGEAWIGRADADGPAVGTITLRKAEPWEATQFVRVLGPDGERVAEATVDVVRGAARWGFEPHAWTGRGFRIADGRFVFQPWRWRQSGDPVVLLVHSAVGDGGASFGPALVTFGDSGTIERAVTLPPGGAVRGRVVDGASEPVFGASVTIDALRPAGFDGDHMTLPGSTVLTDESGAFVFPGLLLGDATLEVTNGVSAAAPVMVAVGSEPVTITLDTATFRCGVRVLGPDGEPAASASVTPIWPSERKWSHSVEDGVVWFDAGRGVAIDVEVGADDCIGARIRGWRPEPGEVRTVRLDRWAATTVTVVGPDDRVVSWAPLDVADAAGRDLPGAKLDRAWGELTVFGVPAGTPLRLAVHDGISEVAVQEAKAGDEDVRVRWLDDRGRLVLLRRSEDRRPLAVTVLADGRVLASGEWHGAAYAFEPAGWPERVDVAIRDRERLLPDDPVAGRAADLTLVRGVPRSGLHAVWPSEDGDVTVTVRFRRQDGVQPGPVEAVLAHASGASVEGDTDRWISIEFRVPSNTAFRGRATDLTGSWHAAFEVPAAAEDHEVEVTLTKSP